MKNEVLEKVVRFFPAYDFRNPNSQKNYGVGDIQVCMLLKGERGAVDFIFNTGIFLRKTLKKTHNLARRGEVNVGYHSYERFFEWQNSHKDCNFLNGKVCYNGSSGLDAQKYLDILINKGDNVVWELLKEYYFKVFSEANTIQTAPSYKKHIHLHN